MPANRKPKAWNLKPQMTAAPHMWKSVEHFLIGDVGQRKDFLTNRLITVDGSPANALTEMGRGIEFLKANSNQIYLNSHKEEVMTRAVLVKVTSTSGVDGEPIVTTALEPGSSTLDRSLYIRSDGLFGAYVFDGAQKLVQSTTAPVVGEIYHVAFTLGSGFLRLYVNGVEEGAVAASGAFTGYSAQIMICGRGSLESNSRYGDLIILQASDWLRELSAEQILEHAIDPFAMLRPAGF